VVSNDQGHTYLTHPFNFFDIRHSGAQDWALQALEKGWLDQYGAEGFPGHILPQS